MSNTRIMLKLAGWYPVLALVPAIMVGQAIVEGVCGYVRDTALIAGDGIRALLGRKP